MGCDHEERILRERQAAAAGEADQLADLAGAGAAPMLVKTKTVGTYPTAAKSYYVVSAVDPGGAEVEGGTLSLSDVDGNFFAGNVGTAIPPVGTELLVRPVGGRWVFGFYE